MYALPYKASHAYGVNMHNSVAQTVYLSGLSLICLCIGGYFKAG